MHQQPKLKPSPRRLVVLGIGNTLMSDDGVGIHVVAELQARQRGGLLPQADIDLLDGGTLGFLLIDRIAGADILVIVDSAQVGERPGAMRVMTDAEIDRFLQGNPKSSVHEVGLIDLLHMMAFSGIGPRRRALVGIQPECMGWGTQMSPAVAACVPLAAAAITRLLASLSEEAAACPG